MKTYYRIEYSLPPHKTWEVFHEDYSNMPTKREALESLVRLRESYETNRYRRSYRFRLVKLKTIKEILDI